MMNGFVDLALAVIAVPSVHASWHEEYNHAHMCSPEGWEDAYEDDCAAYKIKGFCNWSDEQFKNYGYDGYHGGHCVECGCQGKWTEWGSYGSCSKTCGEGVETKTRTCTGPTCPGPGSLQRACQDIECGKMWCAPDNWVDSGENDCATYGRKGYCDSLKGYEADFGKDGFDGRNCEECGCDGKKAPSIATTARPVYTICAPKKWKDMFGYDCAKYGYDDFCSLMDGFYSDYQKDGFHGGHCRECGCDGPDGVLGQAPATPAPVTIPTQATTTKATTSTPEDKNCNDKTATYFDDQEDDPITESDKFSHSLANGYMVEVTGWTHIRTAYAKGYVRNAVGVGHATVSGLRANTEYNVDVYEYAKEYPGANSVSVGSQNFDTVSSASEDPTVSTAVTSDADGKIFLKFTKASTDGAKHIHFSGLSVYTCVPLESVESDCGELTDATYFNDQEDDPITESDKFSHSLANGYMVEVTGWTHIRTAYAKGYVRNAVGVGHATVTGLRANTEYNVDVYEYASQYPGANSVSVGSQNFDTVSSASEDPTVSTVATSDADGKIFLKFTKQSTDGAKHIHFSGLSVYTCDVEPAVEMCSDLTDATYFDDQEDDPIVESDKFTHSLANGYMVEVTGWTHIRTAYAKGYVRNAVGVGHATITGLEANTEFTVEVYEYASMYPGANSVSVGSQNFDTVSSASEDPTVSTVVTSDSDGKIALKFTKKSTDGAKHIHFSGLSVSRTAEYSCDVVEARCNDLTDATYFDDQEDDPITESDKFTHTLANGYMVEVTGWTHIRTAYAKGYVRNAVGVGHATITGLKANTEFTVDVYEYASMYPGANSVSVGSQNFDTVSSASEDPTVSTVATSDSDGKIFLKFTKKSTDGAKHIHFSGLSVSRTEDYICDEETAIEQLTATLSSEMKMATMIEFSEALTDPSSEEYKLAAENIKGVFGAEMENMAEVMGAILERMEVLFEEGSSTGRRRRGSSTEAVITSVFSVTISESTDLTQLENDVISSSTSAANAAIANSGGEFISADAVITVSVGIETAEASVEGQMNGVIEYLWMDAKYPSNAEEEWQIDAACDEVRVISTHLLTEGETDFVYVDGVWYSDDAEIDQIVPKSSFTVKFTSDDSYNLDGFRLEWSCPEEPIIGEWGEWGEYSPCSATCGPGSKSRDRVCEDGVDCDESETGAQETEDCDDAICYIDECLRELHDCDSTQRCEDTTDAFNCVDMDECLYNMHNCDHTEECTNTIGSFTCDPIIGVWGEWGEYSTCSVTCGPGSKSRDRVCEDGVDCDESVTGAQEAEDCEDKICGPNPCPSTECWTHDGSTNTCTMKTECATLTCGATAFDVTFKSALFNLDDNQSIVTMAGGIISPVWDGSQWTTNNPLGENGMTYAVDADKNEVTFAIKFAIVGNDMRTRNDDIQDNVIDLGSLSVVTTPFGAAVVFTCTYSMTIDVASEDYTVTGASVVDSITGVGSLAAGFTMTLDDDESPVFLLGSIMPVAVTWSVTALTNLQFYLHTCTVTHGTTSIMVMKEGCYSENLGVVAIEHDSQAEQGFSYQIFKGVGETESTQTITCSLNLCEVGQCNNPTSNDQCPANADDVFYGYII